ncbi:MAG: sulfotransferase [Actinobacteria bacterium]|nr:sulfotransferase [Actinomycetota bacterium]MBO0833985.1 sulfotransferase [Actinomycetota bacterium]
MTAARRSDGPQATVGTLVAAERDGLTRAGDDGGSAPVIVLTYAHAGGARLQALLSMHPALTCTTGTGLLAACDQAAAAWRQADGRPRAPMSPLAKSSVRGLATAMMTAIVARTGKRRWCETAAAERSAAETFLTLFPNTRFVCLHRACPDVIVATLRASPWGLNGVAYAAYTAIHPASTVAALAAWWVDRTRPLLAFEEAHPESCLRVRYENLTAEPGKIERDILAFLGLDARGPWLPEPPGEDGQKTAAADIPGGMEDLPVGQIPAPLLVQVNELSSMLGYPQLNRGV